jgi:hypothetical protein
MRLLIFIITLNLICLLKAGDDLEFEPITEKDWAITENPDQRIEDAVILFEKIIIDDEKLIDNKCYYTIYRRIRILNHIGRSQGDVTAPFFSNEQKVEKIVGRTILPDGKEFQLDKSKILDKEIFKNKDFKVEQKFFHMPRVTDNCIIEYIIKLRLKNPRNFWVIERDIYLKYGQVIWKFYKGKGLSGINYSFLSDYVTPNYIWFNTQKSLNVEFIPSLKEPEEVHFSIDDIAPFEDEKYTLPELALKANLRYYYGTNDAPAAFWGQQSDNKEEYFRKFTDDNSSIKEIIKEFGNLPSKQEKINAAYKWIQDNIEKTGYAEDKDFDENENINDILKHRYGDGTDIDLLFYDMLREMNIDAKIAYVVDRDENLFEEKAKYWQFDRSIVTVKGEDNKYTCYDPSTKYLPFGSLLWYNEAIPALLVGSQSNDFINTTFSTFRQNHITRMLTLKMDENLSCYGIVDDIEKGHPARNLRIDLDETTELDRRSQLKDYYKKVYPYGEIDSIEITNLKDPDNSIKIRSKIFLPQIGQNTHDRIILKVSDLLGYQKNELISEKRKYPIIFDYAKEIYDIVKLEIPENYEIEHIPTEQLISNLAGACQMKVMAINNNRIINITRLFRLEVPFFKVEEYPRIRFLFQMRDHFNDAAIILKKI